MIGRSDPAKRAQVVRIPAAWARSFKFLGPNGKSRLSTLSFRACRSNSAWGYCVRIALQIRWLSVLLVLCTAVMIGSIMYVGYVSISRIQQEESLRQILASDTRGLRFELNGVAKNVRLLALLPSLGEIVSQESSSDGAKKARIDLETIFSEVLRSNEFLEQIRFIGIDDGGREVVRVDQRDSAITMVPEDQLQQKGGRYYFREAKELPTGEVYISQIDLNRENNQIETPYRSMLRIAASVSDRQGQVIGVVVVNVSFESLIQKVLQPESNQFRHIICNGEGDYLVHPDSSREFGFEFDNRQLVQTDYPMLGDLVSSQDADHVVGWRDGQRQLMFRKFEPFTLIPGHPLVMGVVATNVRAYNSGKRVAQAAFAATFGLMLLAALAGLFTSSLLTRPLNKITVAAKQIKTGERVVDLPSDRNDEIGVLARAFALMLMTVDKNELELKNANQLLLTANSDLEHFTHLAAHDLREPLRKQRNLLELLSEQNQDRFDDESRLLTEQALLCVEQMSVMIRDFRTLTRVASEQLNREQIDLDKIIDNCIAGISDQLQRRNVIVRRDPMPDDIRGYPTILRLLYDNLVTNALTHVKSDSFLLHFTAEQKQSKWVFGVRNTGSTIPDRQLREVFKMFRKVDGESHSGTGVGLSLCKRIVDKHSGTIFAESGDDFTHIKFTLET